MLGPGSPILRWRNLAYAPARGRSTSRVTAPATSPQNAEPNPHTDIPDAGTRKVTNAA